MKNSKKKRFLKFLNLLLIGLLIFPAYTFSQQDKRSRLSNMHKETIDDAYVPVLRDSMQRSPAYRADSSFYFTRQVNVDEAGNNIVGDASNEPSIAVDPTNPNRIVIGWRHFNTIASNFRQAGYGYSLDGGETWTFPGVLTPGLFRSDPVLDFDKHGNFYYNSLQESFACDVFKIDDGGVEWGEPIPAKGGDKQWMRIDRTDSLSAGHNYSYWNLDYTTCYPGNFTRSTDNSNTFEACALVAGSPIWGTLALDAEGNLYTVGQGSWDIIVSKSSTASNPLSSVLWDFTTVVDLDGYLEGFIPVNPQGLLGQSWIDVDISHGPGQGNVYVLASVHRNSINDPGDVMFAKSTDDGGQTFSEPIRINTDLSTSAYQWFGTMSVAPNGRIDVVWLDTRDAPTGTFHSTLYYSFSIDRGETWFEEQPISLAFDPSIGYPQQSKMGDYFDMVSDNQGAHLAWTNTINGGQDVYYTRIIPKSNIKTNNLFTTSDIKVDAYPNPFTSEVTFEIQSNQKKEFILEIFNSLGVCVKKAELLQETTTIKLDKSLRGVYYYQISDFQNNILNKGKLLKVK